MRSLALSRGRPGGSSIRRIRGSGSPVIRVPSDGNLRRVLPAMDKEARLVPVFRVSVYKSMTAGAQARQVRGAESDIRVRSAANAFHDTMVDLMAGAQAAPALVVIPFQGLVPCRLPPPHTPPCLPRRPFPASPRSSSAALRPHLLDDVLRHLPVRLGEGVIVGDHLQPCVKLVRFHRLARIGEGGHVHVVVLLDPGKRSFAPPDPSVIWMSHAAPGCRRSGRWWTRCPRTPRWQPPSSRRRCPWSSRRNSGWNTRGSRSSPPRRSCPGWRPGR